MLGCDTTRPGSLSEESCHVLAGPQHRATTRAPRSTTTRGRRRAATPTRSRKTDTTGRHRAASGPSPHPGRRLTLSAALNLAAVAAPTTWATDLIGPSAPAPASTASDAPPPSEPGPEPRADDAALPGVDAPSIEKKDHRANRQPPVSRGGSVRAQPQLPDWLATCDTSPLRLAKPTASSPTTTSANSQPTDSTSAATPHRPGGASPRATTVSSTSRSV